MYAYSDLTYTQRMHRHRRSMPIPSPERFEPIFKNLLNPANFVKFYCSKKVVSVFFVKMCFDSEN